MSNEPTLKELAQVYLKLGSLAFGGPAAHIAMMEDEVVKRRQWITHEYFLDLLGATNLIPGPNSTEMAIHIGYAKAGWKGLIVAGVCFILPAVSITLLLAHIYVTFGSLPQIGTSLWGIRPAVIAVIFSAVFRLGKPNIKNKFMLATGAMVLVLNLLNVDEIILLFCGGVAGLLWTNRERLSSGSVKVTSLAMLPIGFISSTSSAEMIATNPPTLTGLGLYFLKIGSVLYGSGYVLVAFLQGGLVDTRHWLTQSQLLDAIAIGQVTPGPVLSTATFVGYLVLGLPGAAVSTAGIFLPSFILVLLTAPFVPRLRASSIMRGFLDGVNAAALGLMLAVCVGLGSTALFSAGTWILLLVALILLFRLNLNPAWIIVGSGIVGWMISPFA